MDYYYEIKEAFTENFKVFIYNPYYRNFRYSFFYKFLTHEGTGEITGVDIVTEQIPGYMGVYEIEGI
jgi:hypothetical protein